MIKPEQPANKVTRLFDYSAGRFSVSARDGEYQRELEIYRAPDGISSGVNITFCKYARLGQRNAERTR